MLWLLGWDLPWSGQCSPPDISATSFCTGRSRNRWGLILLPFLSRSRSARVNLTVRTRPSALWLTADTRASSHWLRAALSSFTMTISPSGTSFRDLVHFWRCWRLDRYSFLHRDQNSSAKCCTRLQRALQYLSADENTPGGDNTILDFIVRMWLGVRGLSESGSSRLSTVKGRLLTTASVSHIRVLSDSSSSCKALLRRSASNTLRTDLIIRSHTPPMWVAVGTFI